MAEESKSYGLAWFLAGLGVGAIVGILYAPKSGRETREDLITGAREGTEYLKNRTEQAAKEVTAFVDKSKEQVSALVDMGKEQVSAIVDKSKEQVTEYVERGREAVDRGRVQWEEFVERGKNLVADQATRVSASVDAGRQAYKTTTGQINPMDR
jgi:gas vesicle protein